MRSPGRAPEAAPKATAPVVDPRNPSTGGAPPLPGSGAVPDRDAVTLALWYRNRYRHDMAMNLRLPPDLAQALRELSEQTGRSQQDLAREALVEYVRDYRLRDYPKEVRHLITPAARRPGDPEGEEDVRRAWAGLDGSHLLALLLEDRESSRW